MIIGQIDTFCHVLFIFVGVAQLPNELTKIFSDCPPPNIVLSHSLNDVMIYIGTFLARVKTKISIFSNG